jgi:hypothetical protein
MEYQKIQPLTLDRGLGLHLDITWKNPEGALYNLRGCRAMFRVLGPQGKVLEDSSDQVGTGIKLSKIITLDFPSSVLAPLPLSGTYTLDIYKGSEYWPVLMGPLTLIGPEPSLPARVIAQTKVRTTKRLPTVVEFRGERRVLKPGEEWVKDGKVIHG